MLPDFALVKINQLSFYRFSFCAAKMYYLNISNITIIHFMIFEFLIKLWTCF